MRYIYLFVYFIFLFSCSYENKTLKEEFEFEDANLHLDTTIVSIIKTYLTESPNINIEVISLYCKSMPTRNNIVLLTASRLANISIGKAIPTSYFKVEGIPILLYSNKLKLDMRQDSLRFTEFIKVYSKKFSITEFALYDPACWILVLSKDKIHVYKSIEEYDEKVGFYEPTVHLW